MIEHMHGGHRKRLRNRFLTEGISSMEPHEILELLLYYSIPQRDTNALAHELILRFGSFSGVLDATFEELHKIDGVSHNTAVLLKLIPALCNIYLKDKMHRNLTVETRDKLRAVLLSYIKRTPGEQLIALLINSKNEIVFCDTIFRGKLDTDFDFKRILQLVSCFPTSVVILAHKQEGDTPVPTCADYKICHDVSDALRVLDIFLEDYYLVAETHFSSLVAKQSSFP